MHITRNIIIIIFITILMLAAIEGALRLLYPSKVNRPDNVIAYTHHPEYLIALKPNLEKEFIHSRANDGIAIKWKTNSNGFRGEEISNKHKYRIMIYGDSNIQARFSTLENTFSYKLQENLRNQNINVEVINAGIVGFGPDQSFLKYQSEKPVYNPDIVIFNIDSGNDFGDLIRNRLFHLNNGFLTRTKFEAVPDINLKDNNNTSFIHNLSQSLLTIRAFQKIADLIVEKFNDPERDSKKSNTLNKFLSILDKEFSIYEKNLPKESSHFGDLYDFDIALRRDEKSSQTKLMLMEKILKMIADRTLSDGTKIMVVIEPASIDISTNLELNYEYLQSISDNYDRRFTTNWLEAKCREIGLDVVNLYPLFKENNPNNLYFKRDDGHWNDMGQELAADLVAKELLEQNNWFNKE